MAIDKKSNAYQSLLNSGYTDEQINQMHEELVAWWKAEDIIKDAEANNSVKVWPMNANLNYYQYWDDSNPAQQWQRWGMNEKYTGEWVKTSNLGYDANIKTSDLDPNYLYWEAAKNRNSKEAWYIARRNDMIASALYNEWLTSREDVANFLSQQNEWMNSTEADRMNTIESVWKRLWQIKPEEEEVQEEEIPEMDASKDTSGKIYWKTTADEWNPKQWIDTLADVNSVFKSMEEARVRNYEEISWMDSKAIAYVISDWASPFSEQTMRDLQKYNPAKYQEIQDELKKIRWQDVVTQISSWWTVNLSSQLDAWENNVTTSMNTYVNKTASGSGAWQLATNLNNALADSEIVSGAREQMEVYKRKIVDIQQSIDELPSLANSYFKWDVPQYVVNAFINNRMQQYQKEIEKYQNLYNASLDEAKLEISQTQWREEMNYKWANLQSDENYKNAELALNKKKAEISNWQWNDDWSYSYVGLNWDMHTLSAEEAKKAINKELYDNATEFIDYWTWRLEEVKKSWWALIWWQCEVFTDKYANQYYWVTMTWDWHSYTTAEEKADYAKEALPQRWYVAVWNYKTWSKASIKYWHTWIVIDYDPKTWIFTTLESNHNWDNKVTIEKHSINDANLQWFRDPSGWSSSKKWSWEIYSFYDTPMRDIFLDAAKWADGKTKEERQDIKIAEQSYSTLYELINTWWELERYLSIPDEVWKVEWEKFMWMLKNADMYEDWTVALDALNNKIINELEHWEELAYALSRLRRLVEIKLRRESWAAINATEWRWNYTNYLPEAWQSPEYMYKKLRALEIDTIPWNLPIEWRWKYIPIFTTYDDYLNSNDTTDELIEWYQQRENGVTSSQDTLKNGKK